MPSGRVNSDGRSDFPALLREWIASDGDLLDCLLALRRLGGEGAVALQNALSLRRVATLKFSWELWEALAEGEGEDADVLLLRNLSPYTLDMARQALWGDSWFDEGDTEQFPAPCYDEQALFPPVTPGPRSRAVRPISAAPR